MQNYLNLTGRMGEDPKTKTLPNGTTLTEFSIATSETWKDRNGEKVERTDWHRVTAFGKTGEIISKYFSRGSVIEIVAKLQYNKWIDKHDQNRVSPQIIVKSFEFPLTQKPREQRQERRMSAEEMGIGQKQPTSQYADEPTAEASDDLPF